MNKKSRETKRRGKIEEREGNSGRRARKACPRVTSETAGGLAERGSKRDSSLLGSFQLLYLLRGGREEKEKG